jgi:hypothetical protein
MNVCGSSEFDDAATKSGTSICGVSISNWIGPGFSGNGPAGRPKNKDISGGGKPNSNVKCG